MKLRVLIIWVLSTTLACVSAAAPSGDAAWIACTKAPTRACVFAEAFEIALASPPSHNSVGRLLSNYAAVDPRGALRLVPAAETYRKTLRVMDDRVLLDAALVDVHAKARNFAEAERLLVRLKGTAAYDGSALALATDVARAQSVIAAVARLRAFGIAPTAARVFFEEVAPLAITRSEDATLMAFAQEADLAPGASADTAGLVYEPVIRMALALLEAGKVQPALAAASRIPRNVARRSALGLLGAVLTGAGRVDEALAAALKIDNVDERNTVLSRMVAAENFDEPVPRDPPARLVRQVLPAAAMQLAESLSGKARDYAHALIARACAASGALAGAWSAARKIATPFSSYHALKSIGAAEAKAGNTRASLETFVRARASARAMGYTLYELIYLQMAVGQFEAAKALMREEALKPQNVLEHRRAQTRLMEAYARAGRVEEAFQTPVDSMRDGGKTAAIARALAEGGFSKKAIATLSSARELGDEKDLTLTQIVFERVLAGALEDAALVLAAISPDRRQFALIALAEAHTKAGNGAKALTLVRQALLLPQVEDYDEGLTFLLGAGSALPK